MRQNSHWARTLTVLELSLGQNSQCARGCARTLLDLTTQENPSRRTASQIHSSWRPLCKRIYTYDPVFGFCTLAGLIRSIRWAVRQANTSDKSVQATRQGTDYHRFFLKKITWMGGEGEEDDKQCHRVTHPNSGTSIKLPWPTSTAQTTSAKAGTTNPSKQSVNIMLTCTRCKR